MHGRVQRQLTSLGARNVLRAVHSVEDVYSCQTRLRSPQAIRTRYHLQSPKFRDADHIGQILFIDFSRTLFLRKINRQHAAADSNEIVLGSGTTPMGVNIKLLRVD